ncbi:glycosyltransferase [Rhodanobacter sp. DHB23]|uniref:glycosyltransferase n=1 Tax=Rhodanobacter sp. DHB23 TaxID=2775923 RepID=UPI00177DDF5C|nr:glycosyltransferase [Rhodanobacter sp. DHB23]MBD8871245.1 glycosyltransferase [Rhodanobacter sp. DHB23]
MQIEERLAQNHARFQRMLDEVEACLAVDNLEQAIQVAGEAAMLAWLKGCGIFASPRLEALLIRIGQAIPSEMPRKRETGRQRHVLTVVSRAFGTGGHTRLACRWIALDQHSRHTLVITRQHDTPIPTVIEALTNNHQAALDLLPTNSHVEAVRALQRHLADADLVVLHIHPDDPLAAVALAGMDSPPPVLFEDHASHAFWNGATASNLVVSLTESATRISITRRGVPISHIGWAPIPLDLAALDQSPGIDIREQNGIPQDAPLLMSCGSAYKFMPINGVALAHLLPPLLDERPDVHVLLVGPAADPVGTQLATDYPGRVHLAGNITEPDVLRATYAACDIYLDVVPFPSNTALCEAAALGKPVLKFAPQAWTDCGFTVDMDAIPQPLYVSRDADDYRQKLRALIDSPTLRAERGKLMGDMLRLCHGDALFQSQIEVLYKRAAELPRIELDESITSSRVELIDILLGKLADNMTEASQSTTANAAIEFSPLSPNEYYRRWLGTQQLSAHRIVAARTRIDATCSFHVVIASTGDAGQLERTLHSLERQSLPAQTITVLGESVATLPGSVTTHSLGTGWVNACNEVAATSTAEWLLPLEAGDVLADDALLLLADKATACSGLSCCYADEDTLLPEGPAAPILKPDVNLDLLRSYPYTGHMLAMRREQLLAIGGLQAQAGAMATYDHVFRCIEQFGLGSIGHLAEPILHSAVAFGTWLAEPDTDLLGKQALAGHLERLGIAHEIHPGVLAGSHRINYLHQRQPPVSIIIPTRDQLPMLNGLIDSLLAKTSYTNYELLIVDNDSREPAACAYLDGIERLNNPQLRVLRWPHPFNYSAINNFAAAQARGEYLILLNNDTAILHADWIETLLNHAQRPEVGIVGAKLHYPDGRIQHAGVALGLRGPADHLYIGEAMDAPGYMHRLHVDQNYTVVTAACLMIRKSVYDQVGGLDEKDFKVSYNDVDLCLKVHKAGYLTVWTPYTRLMHEGNVSQTKVDKTASEAKIVRFKGEQEAMYRKWLPLLARDPAYNRNLGLAGNGFDLAEMRVRAWQPFEQPALPNLFCIAADDTGCGQYRIIQPFHAMQRAGLAEGMIGNMHLPPVMMERYAPTSLVLQRQYTDGQVSTLRNYREFIRAFKVYELDDYLPNVPLKSMHRGNMPKDILKSLRKAVSLTDRFVVSTEPLAEAFADLHSDIRVVLNRLPVDWWGDLRGARRNGAKPRVGWGGGSSHRGDLELIADVVRDLADEVEWVFFGMCPEKLRPHVHEYHDGVPISQYPAKLASLDLDLALAPLEDNLFNACKSNLRLLEYGACGFPVVCSDIVCYRGDLPVTRVRNRYKEWTDAIRVHINDLDATARMGEALREAVHRDWMLTGGNLVAWRDAWLPS